jgi:phosphoenolpyruvate carboxylase
MLFPLFESVDDLINSHTIMEQLYTNETYHLKKDKRNEAEDNNACLMNQDGGYFNGQLSIYKGQRGTTAILENGVKVTF